MGNPLSDFFADITKQYLAEMAQRKRVLEVIEMYYEHAWDEKVRLRAIYADVCVEMNVPWTHMQYEKVLSAIELFPNDLQIRLCFGVGSRNHYIRNLRRRPEMPKRQFSRYGRPINPRTSTT